MKYKLISNAHNIEGMFGVDYYSLEEKYRPLFLIASDDWTAEEVQKIIDECNAIVDTDFHYQVEDSLGIIIDKNDAYFYNLNNREKKEEDLKISFQEFIDFMKDFKKFIEDNS